MYYADPEIFGKNCQYLCANVDLFNCFSLIKS